MNTACLIACSRFHSLAACAARNGGFWVSAAGGTANAAAGVIARKLGCSFEEARRGLDLTADTGWYQRMFAAQPFTGIPVDIETEEWQCRFDVRVIAAAAAAGVPQHYR